MAKVITTELQHSGASGANITLDSSKNVTCENNLQVDGNLTVTGTIPADKLTGALPAISGASLTGITTRTTPFRNIIINGAMQVAQRGTSSTTSGYATVDRFTTTWSGQDEAPTQEQASLTTSDTGPWAKGFRKALKITNGNQSSGAGAADSSQTLYKMEGQDLNHSGWDYADPNSKITLSFWAKSSVAQTFYIRLRGYATGGQMQYYAGFALAANTWTKVTKTIPGHASLADIPNNTSTGLFLVWQHYYGTDYTGTQTENAWHAKDTANNYPDMTTTWWTTNDATFMLTGVQLEAGDTATVFEHKKFQDELYNCQRYYQQVGTTTQDGQFCIGASHLTSAGDQTRVGYFGQNNLRATPTITEFGDGLRVIGSGSNTPALSIDDINVTPGSAYLQFNATCTDIGDDNEIVVVTNTANGGIQISAEL